MKKIFKGKVWKFGDCIDSGNIKGVMAGIDPEFHKKVQPGDVIVAGINFGMGSSAEDAPRSLRDAGIAAILAESISNIYLRTLINLGCRRSNARGSPASSRRDMSWKWTWNRAECGILRKELHERFRLFQIKRSPFWRRAA